MEFTPTFLIPKNSMLTFDFSEMYDLLYSVSTKDIVCYL